MKGSTGTLYNSELRHVASDPEIPLESGHPPTRPHALKRFITVIVIASALLYYAASNVVLRHCLPQSRHLDPAKTSSPGHSNPGYLIEASHGAVASENVVCSNVGVDILKDGGNAVDAIIGAVFCIGVVNMFS